MQTNRKRRRSARRGTMPPALARYWAGKRRSRPARRRRNAPLVANARPRRRVLARRGRRRSVGAPGFASVAMLKQAMYAAAGIAAPALVTDMLLPRVGLTLTGIPNSGRRFARDTARSRRTP